MGPTSRTGSSSSRKANIRWEKEWRDNKTAIESMLAKIVARLEIDAKKELEWREASRLAAIRREEEQRIRAEQKALRKAESKGSIRRSARQSFMKKRA